MTPTPEPRTVDEIEPRQIYKLSDVCRLLGLSRHQASRYAKAGVIAAFKYGTGPHAEWYAFGSELRRLPGLPDEPVRTETKQERTKRGRDALDRIKAMRF